MKNSKKFIRLTFGVCFGFILLVGGINYIVDPLWVFSHKNKLNSIQDGFDERQQKTNKIYFDYSVKFNTILLGSSRTTYINQTDFHKIEVFNYSVSSMYPYEYEGYINFSKDVFGKDLDYIIIGMDFYGSNIPKDISFENPEFYIQNTQSFFYKYKTIFSLDILIKSFKNIKNIKVIPDSYYSRNNVKFSIKPTEQKRLQAFNKNLARHTMELSGNNYQYNENFKDMMIKIRNDNPNTKFIIFTSPVTAHLVSSIMIKGENFDNHKRWLNELVDVFGEVYDFCGINSITKNVYNYPDDDHYYPEIGKLVAHKLSNKDNKNIPKDFGILVTKDNIDLHLKNLKQRIKDFDSEQYK